MSELVKRGHDQVAELKSSCGAVDVRDVAQLISDLATQLDVQLARSNALAAENAGLKELIEQHANSVAVCPNCSHEEPSETDDIVALYRSMETPATEAVLAEVRNEAGALAVELFAQTLGSPYSVRDEKCYEDGFTRAIEVVRDIQAPRFAFKIRQAGM
ncbi:hypothetical protein [Enterobacter hormaechei]|uniref:hypothetical protein n=1 Tax=Enterobacter hormaechei TaxID=158836 RepID=UPI0018EA6F57|nr:hypothetical protein [Enterobacter hormaechei]